MTKRLSITTLFVFIIVTASAQVTVGSEVVPEKAALLDIKTKDGGAGLASSDAGGLLLPRVTINDVDILGIFSEVTGVDTQAEKLRHKGLSVYNIGSATVPEGLYIWNGSTWQAAGSRKPETNFFYMPSVVIDVNLPPYTINLYQIYKDQFQNPKASCPAANGIPVPYFTTATDLLYYVTDFDAAVFNTVNITDEGVMTYTLQSNLPLDVTHSYMNIVFVEK